MPTSKPNDRNPKRRGPEVSGPLERGRACFERQQWNDAFEALSAADQSTPLGAEDLHRLAWSAGLTARDEEMLATQERLYHAHLEVGEGLPAARAAFWLGFRLLARGEAGRAGGWLGRAQRLVERDGRDCVEQGYLLLPVGQRHLSAGELREAYDAAARAAEFGDRFGEADLAAFARNLQGRALLNEGRLDRGLALLDEAMVAATSGELSPIVTGIIYCSAIASCQRVYALDRLVRGSSPARDVYRTLPRPPCGDHAAEWLLAGGRRGGSSRGGALRARDRTRGGWPRALPASGDSSAAR
jgi:tetratricopeptide (TPR) repeat protein